MISRSSSWRTRSRFGTRCGPSAFRIEVIPGSVQRLLLPSLLPLSILELAIFKPDRTDLDLASINDRSVPGKTFAGEMGIVTGWGAVKEGGPVSHTLQEVYVPILSNSECRDSKYPSNRITNNMMCAGYKDGGKDSCQVSENLHCFFNCSLKL